MKILLSFIGLVILTTTSALAQDVPAPIATWGSIVEPLLLTIGTVLASLLTALIARVTKGVGISLELQTQQKIDQALRTSLQFGLDKVKTNLDQKDIEFKNGAVNTAAEYFVKNWPDTVKKLGLEHDKILDMLSARFGEELFYVNRSTTPEPVPQG